MSVLHAVLAAQKCLPFLEQSSMLSVRVPTNRCRGFTQARLSQWWHTSRLRSISAPVVIIIDRRLAVIRRWPILNIPYPAEVLYAFHSQQSSGPRRLTFDQNLATSLSVSCISHSNDRPAGGACAVKRRHPAGQFDCRVG